MVSEDTLFGRAWRRVQSATPDEFLEETGIPEAEFFEFVEAVTTEEPSIDLGTFGAAFQLGYNVRREQEDES